MQHKSDVINVTQMLNIIIYSQNTDSFGPCIVCERMNENRGSSQSIQLNNSTHWKCVLRKMMSEKRGKNGIGRTAGRLWTHVLNICMSTKWQNVVIVNVDAILGVVCVCRSRDALQKLTIWFFGFVSYHNDFLVAVDVANVDTWVWSHQLSMVLPLSITPTSHAYAYFCVNFRSKKAGPN